jgi:hypothetical protein
LIIVIFILLCFQLKADVRQTAQIPKTQRVKIRMSEIGNYLAGMPMALQQFGMTMEQLNQK